MLRLYLLGLVQIERDGQMFSQFRSRKSLALLGYLVNQEQAVSRSRLAALLWPDKPEAAGRRDLRWTLNYLGKLLPTAFEATHQTIAFRPTETLWVDTVAFEALAGRDEADSLAEAAGLYRGEFLADLSLDDCPEFELWLLQVREHWRQRVIKVLSTLVEHYLDQGDYARGQDFATRWLEIEPWRESAHRQLMRLLALSGQRSAALTQYETCRRILANELDVEPMAETMVLYEQIRAGKLSRGAEEQRSRGAGGQGQNRKSKIQNRKSQDWGEAPDTGAFYGRQAELARLEHWLITGRCRLVAVLGMGGVGKTALAAKLAKSLAEQFDFVFWRSLINAPPPAEVLRAVLQFLSAQTLTDFPGSLDEQLALLFDYLRRQRCLLILDNVESVLQSERAGNYKPGYEAYGQLIQRMGQSQHQSCLLLTGRERPQGVARLEGDTPLVRSLQLGGLTGEAGQEILNARGLSGPVEVTGSLVARYSGNPLALKLICHTIQELFENDIAAFLSAETPIFDDIRAVLDQQFARLSPLEREILLWLAIEREAISYQVLAVNLIDSVQKRSLLEALRALQRRSLLEQVGDSFTLQNVVTEYTTDHLIEGICREIEAASRGAEEWPRQESEKSSRGAEWQGGRGEPSFPPLLNSHALLKAQAREYVRQSQVRLILEPVAERLTAHLGPVGLESTLRRIVTHLQRETPLAPGYAAGNILNLLVHLGVEVQGDDFSRLSVWQAYLQDVRLPEVNFAGADLTGSVFSETFGFVTSVAFGPATGEQNLIVAGTENGEIRLWQVAGGRPVGVYHGHTSRINSLLFSPDGRTLASGSADQTIRLWEVKTGQPICTLHGHTDGVTGLAFSPDGQLLASGSVDQTIRLWDLKAGQVRQTLFGHTDAVLSVAFSPDTPADAGGRTLASSGADRTILLWDIATGQTCSILPGHTEVVTCVAFSPDGRTLASSSFDRTVRLWDVTAGQAHSILSGHTDFVWSVAFSPDGRTLASGSMDRTVRLWDVNKAQLCRTLRGHTDAVLSVAFSPDTPAGRGQPPRGTASRTLASGSMDRTVRLWDVRTGQLRNTLWGYTRAVHSVGFSPGGKILASGGYDRFIRLWDISTALNPGLANVHNSDTDRAVRAWPGHSDTVYVITFSPKRDTLASSSADHTIRLWDISTALNPGLANASALASGQPRQTLRGHTDEVSCLAFSSDGEILASGSNDQTIRLWDVKRRPSRHLHTLQGHTHWVNAVAFSPDTPAGRGQPPRGTGNWTLASGSSDRTVRLWEVKPRSGQLLHTWQTDMIFSLAFSLDGRILAGGGHDGVIRLWDVKHRSEQVRHTLEGHTRQVLCLAFNPDGRLLASGSGDQTIRLWEVKTGRAISILSGHTGQVPSVAFSPNGQTLASGSLDETVKLWDVRTGKCLKTFHCEGPYAGMDITGATGLTMAQKQALIALGAVEHN